VPSKTQSKTTYIMSTEIKYEIEGRRDRGQMSSYHRKPSFRDMSKGAKSSDIKALKSSHKRNLVDLGDGNYDSRFTIGMEVEKTSLSRGAVKEYALEKQGVQYDVRSKASYRR